MGRSRYRFLSEDTCPYFVTATTVNWLPLFSNPRVATILLDSIRFLCESKRITLFAYVIMENHLHLIASSHDLSGEIAKFKSFAARNRIDYYAMMNDRFTLNELKHHKLKQKMDRLHQFWQEGSHPQRIESPEVMRQKVEYIHENPVRRVMLTLWRTGAIQAQEIMLGSRGVVTYLNELVKPAERGSWSSHAERGN